MKKAPVPRVEGFCDERFARVKAVFTEHLAKGMDHGASFAVTLDGKLVVDLWGGYSDPACTHPWVQDSLVCVFSSTKIMAAMCIFKLLDQCKIELDAPVASYWPEFGQAGKAAITIRQVMSHTAGVPIFGEPVTYEGLTNWVTGTGIIERGSPIWTPGTKIGYHAITYGFILGEIVRRVTGQTLGTYFHETFARPLGLDFYIGLPEPHQARVADLIMPKRFLLLWMLGSPFWLKKFRDKMIVRVFSNPPFPTDWSLVRSKQWLEAELPSSNGHGNARSMALTGAIVACGGMLEGKRWLSEEAINEAIRVQFVGKDMVQGMQLHMGLGGNNLEIPNAPSQTERSYTWGGLGGSFLVMDREAHLSYAFAMNRMHFSVLPDRRHPNLEKAVNECYRAMK